MIGITTQVSVLSRFKSHPGKCLEHVLLSMLQNNHMDIKFEILTLVAVNSAGFWGVTPFNLVDVYRREVGTCCLHLQDRILSLARTEAIKK
jgi:hypothetical protein